MNYQNNNDFTSKQQFAKIVLDTALDPIYLPPQCYSEFICPWACDNMVNVKSIDIFHIINPSNYKEG